MLYRPSGILILLVGLAVTLVVFDITWTLYKLVNVVDFFLPRFATHRYALR
ncbi:MAG: hypothetical protein ACLFUS_15990 [Candidatus Sumerlaeia bacterium]